MTKWNGHLPCEGAHRNLKGNRKAHPESHLVVCPITSEVRRALPGLASGLALASGPLGWQSLQGHGAPQARGWRGQPRQCATLRSGACDIFPARGILGVRVMVGSWYWRARQRDTAGTAGGLSPRCLARQPPHRKDLRPKDAAKAAAP